MNRITQDFVSEEPRKFHVKLGHYLASSLAGFVIGVVAASIIWFTGVWYNGQLQNLQSYNNSHASAPIAPTAPIVHKAPAH
jgi:hypothetical protein